MLSKQIAYPLVLLRQLAAVFMVLLAACPGQFVCASRGEAVIEQITGVVVAYDELKPSLTCIEGCETSLIVRIDKASELRLKYIRIDLRFKDRHSFPKELISRKGLWRFTLIRTPEHDESMEEFILGEDVYGKNLKTSIWRRVPGSDEEKLPFGEVLRSYSLKRKGFKRVKD